jgi:catalase (peroxidase I)
MNDLIVTIGEKSRDFLKKIEQEYEQLEEISVPFLREKQETFIEESVERYYETLNHLQDNFRNILNEEVHDTRGSLSLGKPRTKNVSKTRRS